VNNSPAAAVLPQLDENGLVPDTWTETGPAVDGELEPEPPPQPDREPIATNERAALLRKNERFIGPGF
jgi:hypothetical protein